MADPTTVQAVASILFNILPVGDRSDVRRGRVRRSPRAGRYPGGQVMSRPASRCRWMWNTVCPAAALQLKTVR